MSPCYTGLEYERPIFTVPSVDCSESWIPFLSLSKDVWVHQSASESHQIGSWSGALSTCPDSILWTSSVLPAASSSTIPGVAILPARGDSRMMTRETAIELRPISLCETVIIHQLNASESRLKSKNGWFGGGGTGIWTQTSGYLLRISLQTSQRSSWSSAKQLSSCLHSCLNPVQLEPAILPGYTIPPLVTKRIPLGLSTQRWNLINKNLKMIKFKL